MACLRNERLGPFALMSRALRASTSEIVLVAARTARSLDCSQRIVVTLAVETGQNGTEEVHASLTHLQDKRHGGGAAEVELEMPLRISLTKSEAIVRYPLTYLRSFNSQPREVITLHGLGGCNDGALAREPSCGWAVDSSGAAIDDSQGFCCSCGLDQLLGVSSQATRSESLSCNLFGNTQSAHCLRMDPLWYAAYQIGEPQLHFTIGIRSSRDDGTGSDGATEEHLELGPHMPGASSQDASVVAQLLGDFASYENELQSLGMTKYLVVPSQPATHPRYAAGTSSWLLIDKSDVTLDGTVCNMVGTSYSAFRHQSSRCGREAGSCLGNQIEDMQQADDQRIQHGETPMRRVTAFEDFEPYQDSSTGAQYMAFTTQSMRSSVVTLTLNADNMRFVVSESSGRIDSIFVRDFEAQSDDGTLLALVTNTGRMNADYSLRVDCSSGLLGIQARALSLMPSEQERVSFALYVESGSAAGYTCNVHLHGSRQTLLDSKNVSFRTSQLVTDFGAQGGTPVSAVGRSEEGSDKLFKADACSYWCKSFFDVACFMAFGCTAQLWRLALFVAVLLACCCGCCGVCKSPACRKTIYNVCCCNLFSSRRGDERPYRSPPGRFQVDLGDFRHRQGPASYGHGAPPFAVDRCAPPPHPQHYGRVEHRQKQHHRRSASLELSTHDDARSRQHPQNAERGTTRYLNLSGEQAKAVTRAVRESGLSSPGDSFSIRGEVTSQHTFGLRGEDDGVQWWRWSSSRQQHVAQRPPTRLNRAFFLLALPNGDQSEFLSREPRFPCLNAQLANDFHGMAADECESHAPHDTCA